MSNPMSYSVHSLRVCSDDWINYCYVICDLRTGQAAIIDPAWELSTIIQLLGELSVKLKMILLTHSHKDHINLVTELTRLYHPEVYMSRTESEFYRYETEGLQKFEDMDELWLGDTRIKCLVTPGHTLGSACYLLDKDIFTGDTIFIEGCGGCFSVGSSAEDLYDSVQRIKNILTGSINVYPGHSFGEPPGQTGEFVGTANIYFQLEKNDFVAFRNRKNQPLLFNFT